MKLIQRQQLNFVLFAGLLIFLALAMTACQGTQRAYEAAEGIDQNAKVVAEHYYALVKEANDMKAAGTLAGGDLVEAQNLVRTTKPVIDRLATAAQAYTAAQTAESEAVLNQAISDAAIAISELIDIINAARE
jgi:hypothetical protein